MEDRSGPMVALNIFFMILCIIVVGLRVYCRGWVIRNFGMDDWLMLVAWFLFTMYLITQLLGIKYGTGKHRSELTRENNSRALMWWFACEVFYISATTFLKFSVGFFLLRIAVDIKHIWTLRILIAASGAFGFAYLFVMVFQCSPVNVFWRENPRAEGCLPADYIMVMTYTASVLNCVADWMFGLLPALIVWGLAMSTKNKIIVGAILSFAAIGSTATIVRSTVLEGLRDGDDFLWATADLAIWSTVEPGIGIAAASMATLRPLVQLFRWKFGLSEMKPSNAAWNERNRTGGRSRSGYIQQSGASSSIPIQNLSSNGGQFHTSIVSGEERDATRQYAIEASQKESADDVRLGASVIATTEVRVTNSKSLETDEYHVQKWGTPWKDQDAWS